MPRAVIPDFKGVQRFFKNKHPEVAEFLLERLGEEVGERKPKKTKKAGPKAGPKAARRARVDVIPTPLAPFEKPKRRKTGGRRKKKKVTPPTSQEFAGAFGGE